MVTTANGRPNNGDPGNIVALTAGDGKTIGIWTGPVLEGLAFGGLNSPPEIGQLENGESGEQ